MLQKYDPALYNVLKTAKPSVLLIGGSFDPPHRVHMQLAYAAAVQLAQDLMQTAATYQQFCTRMQQYWLVFIPARHNPLKAPLAASGELRLQMISALIAHDDLFNKLVHGLTHACITHYGQPAAINWQQFWLTALTIHISPLERCHQLEEPSYTVDVVTELREWLTETLALVIGSDNLLRLSEWHNYDDLLQQIDKLYVASRTASDTLPPALQTLPSAVLAKIQPLTAFVANDLSSTVLRQMIAHQQWIAVTEQTCPEIVNLIKKHSLYSA